MADLMKNSTTYDTQDDFYADLPRLYAQERELARHDAIVGATNGLRVKTVLKRKPRPNPLNGIEKVFRAAARNALEQCAREIDDLERHAIENGHVDTGALRDSIHHSNPVMRGNVVSVKGYADAKNNGVMYEEFLEHGSGKYRDDGTGRKTPWVYYKPGAVNKTSKGGSIRIPEEQAATMRAYRTEVDDINAQYSAWKHAANKAKQEGKPIPDRPQLRYPREPRFDSDAPNVETEDGAFFTTEGIEPTHFVSEALEIVNPKVSELFRQCVVAEMKTSGRYQQGMEAKAARSARAKKAAQTRKRNKH